MVEARDILLKVLKSDFTDPTGKEVYQPVSHLERLVIMHKILDSRSYPLPNRKQLAKEVYLRQDPKWARSRGNLPEITELLRKVDEGLAGGYVAPHLSKYVRQRVARAFVYRQPVSSLLSASDLGLTNDDEGIFDPKSALIVEEKLFRSSFVSMLKDNALVDLTLGDYPIIIYLTPLGFRSDRFFNNWARSIGNKPDEWLPDSIRPFALKDTCPERKILQQIESIEGREYLHTMVNSQWTQNTARML